MLHILTVNNRTDAGTVLKNQKGRGQLVAAMGLIRA